MCVCFCLHRTHAGAPGVPGAPVPSGLRGPPTACLCLQGAWPTSLTGRCFLQAELAGWFSRSLLQRILTHPHIHCSGSSSRTELAFVLPPLQQVILDSQRWVSRAAINLGLGMGWDCGACAQGLQGCCSGLFPPAALGRDHIVAMVGQSSSLSLLFTSRMQA